MGVINTHNLALFQNFTKEMGKIKQFTKSTERRFELFKMALQNISWNNTVDCNNYGNSLLILNILQNYISSLEEE